MDRIQILRDRIFELVSRPEGPLCTSKQLIDYCRFMKCSPEEAKQHFEGAHNAERERKSRIIAQLEAELAAEIAKWNTPIQQRQPRKK